MHAVRGRRGIVIGTLLVALAIGGCAGWRTEQVAPKELLRTKGVRAVRVTRTDESRVEIWNPSIIGDSIVGNPTERAIAKVVMPISQVQSIATWRTSVKKTLLVGLGVIAGVAAYGLLMELNQVQ